MSFMSDFKNFALKGNVFDMAIGVVMGGAFGKIVSSLVADIIMPMVSSMTGKVNISELAFEIKGSVDGAEPILIKYGIFLQNILDFTVIALCIFMVIRIIAKSKKKEEEQPSAPPAPSNEEVLLSEIRDLLKK